MSEKLKPCPFTHDHIDTETLEAVGEDPLIVLDNEESGGWSVFCILCGMRGPQTSARNEAIAAWNRRAPQGEPSEAGASPDVEVLVETVFVLMERYHKAASIQDNPGDRAGSPREPADEEVARIEVELRAAILAALRSRAAVGDRRKSDPPFCDVCGGEMAEEWLRSLRDDQEKI